MNKPQFAQFLEKLSSIINNKKLVKLILSNKRSKSSDLKSVIISIVEIKKGDKLNFVYRHNTKDITKNYEFTEGIALIAELLSTEFFNANVFAETEEISLLSNAKGHVTVKSKALKAAIATNFTHDHQKEKHILTSNNIYLRELGVCNANFELRREMNDKYRQINRYVELLEPYLKEISLNKDSVMVDMGSGKGYLTFALCDYITNRMNVALNVTGVEYRPDLVEICNTIAQKAEFDKLKFIQGTIADTQIDRLDILIALHACDTATDDAIFRGIKSNASLIVVAPCCHKQIRKAMNVSNELSSITQFGILKERQAEILTDSIRALLMEAHGYKTNVFEFISGEHTPKNIMIVGRKVQAVNPDKAAVLANIAAIKALYGIEGHYLEGLLEV